MNKIAQNPFGISSKSYLEIVRILRNQTKIKKVLVFGSRAMGNYKNGSDVDLAIIFDKKADLTDFLNLQTEFEANQIIPYKIDLLDFNNLENQALIQHINDFGKEFHII